MLLFIECCKGWKETELKRYLFLCMLKCMCVCMCVCSGMGLGILWNVSSLIHWDIEMPIKGSKAVFHCKWEYETVPSFGSLMTSIIKFDWLNNHMTLPHWLCYSWWPWCVSWENGLPYIIIVQNELPKLVT